MTTIATLFALTVIGIPFACAQESSLALTSHSTTAGSYYYDDGSFDIAMFTFFLLLIPSLIGLSLSFALIKDPSFVPMVSLTIKSNKTIPTTMTARTEKTMKWSKLK
jgi:hypothetical protein